MTKAPRTAQRRCRSRPTEIKLHQKSRLMEIAFADGKTFRLPYEFLRVYSPSAEVRGHGRGRKCCRWANARSRFARSEPVGSYAVQPAFSDSHATGIYSWDYLTTWARTRNGSGPSIWKSWTNRAPGMRMVDTEHGGYGLRL